MCSEFRHGVIVLPEHSWTAAREQWTRVEELGFHHAWTYDHLVWRWFKEKTWHATIPTLTAAAMATKTLHLGTLVASPSVRHPVALVKDMLTLNDISGGRIVCGIGSGARGGADDVILGKTELSNTESLNRFREFVELTSLLLHQPVTTYSGDYFSTTDAYTYPGVQRDMPVPLAVAATGPKSIREAAKHADIWVTTGWGGHGDLTQYDAAIPALRRQIDKLDEGCLAEGRDPTKVRRMLVTGARIGGEVESLESYRDACGQLSEIGFTDIVSHWPRADHPYQAKMSVFEKISTEILSSRAT
ncbi:LLM class flavin-dependent oxidoreductase [Rhodococcus sp. 06-235-1A]|uniref:LLM class flavin-dependent oxidoreductase n=1 Tax=Rhodococcus sp. 06-235-1A TaxID=2022508 RepID=UPI000B9B866C|nr:LLM class flavin-dependent oxidoreductase [Rhodococcus sp. 06-235-1A]OZD03364.1 LLM class flavin-dependent oxidoreductase [Rhodococcus sp. 06-235-1A]